ncbi:HpcH/HpaI aldolase/citrate lyase family protein [Gulosibacter sp. 10]|uniref:HpcH/HpaI aldolase family protein n=1 Tax=Gulosibacter sp. 10 TaxID=1255570 RepID=UPI00097E875A|nr:aldolase/citrate lyase family protein [Gulosibacter sp. 10]SJM64014.1 2,4-dihydroxyhept-2-ene-1,7-dioic acid aldolase [Gulosibacter sp. 10]
MSAAHDPVALNHAFKERLRSGETVIGTFLGLGSPAAAEVCAAGGLDWVLLDLEHGAGSEAQIGEIVTRAAAYGAATLVRVEELRRIRLGRVLDTGAAGVMVPRVSSVEEVRDAASAMQYPPAGTRGVASYNRQARWSLDPAVLRRAGERHTRIVQIETRAALDAVEEIAAEPGADVLFVGPQDLSYALGLPLQYEHPEFAAALDRVVAAAEAHGKAAGILVMDPVVAERRREQGFRFIGIGSDASMLAASSRAAAKVGGER